MTSLERSRDFGCGDFLFGFGVANFLFRRCVAFLFRVAAVYVIGGAMFGVLFTLCSVAVFGGCTGGDGGTAGKCVGETVGGVVSTLGSDAGKSLAGWLSPGKDIGGMPAIGASSSPLRASSKVDFNISAITLRAEILLSKRVEMGEAGCGERSAEIK